MFRRSSHAAPGVSRRVLALALGLAGLAVLLLTASFVLDASSDPAMLNVSRGLRDPGWLALLCALVVGAVAYALRSRGTDGGHSVQPDWFQDSTEFARSTVLPPEQPTPEHQQALSARAEQHESARPTCPSCGQQMVGRSQRKGDREFWGCADFPRCRATLPMRD